MKPKDDKQNIFILSASFISQTFRTREPVVFFPEHGQIYSAWSIFSNSLDQLNTGFASNGFMLSLESNYSFNGRFSLKGMALLNTNTVNRLPLFTNLNDHLKKTISIDITDQKFLSLTENPWVTNGLLVGPAYTITFNKLKWDLYGTGGLSVIYLPAPQFIYQNPSNNWVYINRNTKPWFFTYALNAGSTLRYPVSERFDLQVGFNIFNSKATQRFEEVKITTTQTGTVIQQLNSGKATVPINIISTSVGLVYYLK